MLFRSGVINCACKCADKNAEDNKFVDLANDIATDTRSIKDSELLTPNGNPILDLITRYNNLTK